jgi:pumilio family protein 6
MVEQAPGWDPEVFSQKFVDVVGKDLGVAMCVKGDRNGTFVIAELCERLMRAKSKGRESVKRWFGADVLELIAQGEAKGKKVLLEKIVLL